MTAEVVVMNRMGVALAADSAITLGGSSVKVYTSAEKIYLLADTAPVGAMLYGGATVVGVPWETVLKVYRQTLGDKAYDSLEEYADHFTSFLQTSEALFPPSAQEEFVASFASGCCQYVHYKYRRALEAALRKKNTLDGEEIVNFRP